MSRKRLGNAQWISGFGCLACGFMGVNWNDARIGNALMVAFFVLGAVALAFGIIERYCLRPYAGGVGLLFAIAGIIFWRQLLPATVKVMEAKVRTDVCHKLKKVVYAMHDYVDAHEGRLPPAALRNSDGRPLLSWRVLILPNLGEVELFREFKLDESWDSEHNRLLIPKMPPVYAYPQDAGLCCEPGCTFWQVFVGPNTAFDCFKGCDLRREFPEGPSSTILLVEAKDPVPWTKPEDVQFEPDQPLPTLGAARSDQQIRWFFNHLSAHAVVTCDSSIHWFSIREFAETEPSLRTFIPRSGKRIFEVLR